jgi:hypothetical protein
MVQNILNLPTQIDQNLALQQKKKQEEEKVLMQNQTSQNNTITVEIKSVPQKPPLDLLENILSKNLPQENKKELDAYKQIKKSETTLKNLNNTILTKVANSVLDARKNGASKNELVKIIDDVKSNIKKDFQNANQTLDNLSKDNQKSINKAYDNIQNSLTYLRANLNHVSKHLQPESKGITHNDFSINLTTNDGDTISVDVSQDKKFTSELSVDFRDGKPSFMVKNTMIEISSLDVEVKGNLDEKEKQVLKDVMNNIENIVQDWQKSSDFGIWDGGINSMDFDTSVISSANMSASNNIGAIYAGFEIDNAGKKLEEKLEENFNKILDKYEKEFKLMFQLLIDVKSTKETPQQIIRTLTKKSLEIQESTFAVENKTTD